ncbi:MAG: GAF domain-containing sensor histidine kinase [Bacteroidales bacterium]|nr:GAF domain-containing sensor histidine kinase [Bacteroidales bacterium]
MEKPNKHKNEKERLNALNSYSILDTLQEKEYDDITFIASQICNTPISYISLIDHERQWFKSKIGLQIEETPREIAFCAHTIVDDKEYMLVEDARKDYRFSDNPLVIDKPGIVFYLGIPLNTVDNYPLGTLCVVDKEPRDLKDNQIKMMQALARQTNRLLEARKNNIELDLRKKELEERNKSLDSFARKAAHDLKSPLNNIVQFVDLLKNELELVPNESMTELFNIIEKSSHNLTQLIDGILKHSRDLSFDSKDNVEFNVLKSIEDVVANFFEDSLHNFNINYDIDETLSMYSNLIAFQQIIINLISNSLKYNDKEKTNIKIGAVSKRNSIVFKFEDNGIGIKDEEIKNIFNLYETTSNIDRYGNKGTGIGLSTVKKIIELLEGTIEVKSEIGVGTIFTFSIKGS